MKHTCYAALLGFLALIDIAVACDCSTIDPREAFDRAALIADIKVARLKRIDEFDAEAKAAVVKSWKGAMTGEKVRFRFVQHNSCASGWPKLNEIFRVAARRDKNGVFEPSVCLSAIIRPENEALLDAYARPGSEGRPD